MGGSGNWLKSLIPLKKSNPNDQQEKKSRKWKLWRSSSASGNGGSVKRGQVAASEASDSTAQLLDDVYSAAMASLIRAPPKDFLLIRQEWAAVRIQTAFRGLLARRASRALRAVVRIQAIFRGRMVRKQAAVTLKCMQALVRAQAQIKARRVRMALEEESLQHKPPNSSDPPKQQPEEEWCDRRGSAEEVKTKLQMKQEAAVKRERAIAYFNSHQQARASPSLNPGRKESFSGPIKPSKSDKSSSAWSWLDGWMASSKPWDSALMEEESVNMSPLNSQHKKRTSNPKPSSKSKPSTSNSMEHESARVTRNTITRRVSARPPGDGTHNNESSLSSSTAALEGTDETASSASVGLSKPRYMSMTASNKAKHRGVVKSRLREAHAAAQYYAKPGVRFSGEVTRTSVDSAPCSVGVAEDLYQPSGLDRFDRSRCR